jgi:D-alanyl-D-alanine carboxypeptidase-like protein
VSAVIRVPVTALLAMAMLAAPAAGAGYRSSVAPVSPSLQAKLKSGGYWHRGCPVALSGLRELTVSYRGFDGRSHTGSIVVNARVARPLAGVFARLWGLRFPIRRMGPLPLNGDVTASFSCRQASPSPCVGGTGTGSWSMHAFGLAVDLNPTENPYVGCGQSRDPSTRRYFDRSRHRRGMVTPRAIQAFTSIGWGWGGSWAGDTKDYMHFSSNGH